MWTEHRRYTMEYIEKACNGISNPSVLVIGSGNCDDIELETLSEKCQYIRFVDIDTESTKRAIKRRIPNAKNVEIVNLNIIDTKDSEFEGIAVAIRSKDGKTIESKFNNVLKKIPTNTNTIVPDAYFDVVVILPIFSQLTAYLYEVLHQAQLPESLHKLVDKVALPRLANYWSYLAINNALSFTKKDGNLVLISDMVDLYEPVCVPFFQI